MECELTRDERFNRGKHFLRLFHLRFFFIYHTAIIGYSWLIVKGYCIISILIE
jgi:hypothetical protein